VSEACSPFDCQLVQAIARKQPTYACIKRSKPVPGPSTIPFLPLRPKRAICLCFCELQRCSTSSSRFHLAHAQKRLSEPSCTSARSVPHTQPTVVSSITHTILYTSYSTDHPVGELPIKRLNRVNDSTATDTPNPEPHLFQNPQGTQRPRLYKFRCPAYDQDRHVHHNVAGNWTTKRTRTYRSSSLGPISSASRSFKAIQDQYRKAGAPIDIPGPNPRSS